MAIEESPSSVPEPAAAESARVGVPSTPWEVLTTTRTVRRRLDLERPVDPTLVRRALDVAAQAPSGGGSPRAHFVVVTGCERRHALGQLYRDRWYRRYGSLLAQLREQDSAPADLESAAHLADVFGQVPVHVVAVADSRGRPLDENQASLWGSVLPAAWSYMLAARTLGLASAWTTTLLAAEDEVAPILGLPEGVRLGAVLPTAHPVGDYFGPGRRPDWASHVHGEQWQG